MDILSRTPPQADHRIPYAEGEFHFGDLWLPPASPGRKAPLVVLYHGGWWRAEYDLAYGGFLCDALKREGIAVWSVEYRRVGNPGGGWPGTFQDAAAGYDFVTMLAKSYALDLKNLVAAGHSAGGHLAFWIAGRQHVPATSEIARLTPQAPRPKTVISLAGAVDLRLTCDLAGYFTFAHDKGEVERLMGGSPSEVPDRYRAGNPGDLLPLNTAQHLLMGTDDGQIPAELPGRWAANAKRQGDTVAVQMLAGADHFDVMDPDSRAWPAVRNVFRSACFEGKPVKES